MPSNTFGEVFRVTTCGESHGLALACIIDSVPPLIELDESMIQPDLDRRRPGSTRYGTPRNEADQVKIISGVFEGKTTGTPIGLIIENTSQRSQDYSAIMNSYRPGHADYTYQLKYGIRDYRGGGSFLFYHDECPECGRRQQCKNDEFRKKPRQACQCGR